MYANTINRATELAENRKNKASVTWLKKRMRDLLGSYSESSYDATTLLLHIPAAMEIARDLDVNPADRWPQIIGTRVYNLMESITELKTDNMK